MPTIGKLSMVSMAQRSAIAGAVLFILVTAAEVSVGRPDAANLFASVAYGLLALGVILAVVEYRVRRWQGLPAEPEGVGLLEWWSHVRNRFRPGGGNLR